MSMLKTVLALCVVLLLTQFTRAQAGGDPSGHWEAVVQVQGVELPLEVDLSRTKEGTLVGTFGQPAQRLRGLPLSDISVESRQVRFVFTISGTRFQGTWDAEHGTLSGSLTSSTFGTVPVTLARKGDARSEPMPKSTPITRDMEGTWVGRLEVDGGLRLRLTLANQPDGTARGTLISLDEQSLELPVAITQEGAKLTLGIQMVSSSYSAMLANGDLVGTYTTAEGFQLPLTLRRDR